VSADDASSQPAEAVSKISCAWVKNRLTKSYRSGAEKFEKRKRAAGKSATAALSMFQVGQPALPGPKVYFI